MKLEVGMYVRTKDKKGITYIRKLTKLANDYPQKLYGMEVDKEIHYTNYLSQKNILKASHTLLGNGKEPCLIEVGDYVNGCLIVEITQDPFIKGQINLWTNMILSEGEPFPNEYYKAKILEKDIKSIVTKQQFSQMEYKVGE